MNEQSIASDANGVIVRQLGRQPYEPIFEAMKRFTDERDQNTQDEIWLVEHDAVFTQGQAGKAEHILMPGDIPVVQVDRGGQVTYHGPGQQVIYLMLNIKRRKLGVRHLVTAMEESVVGLLAKYGVTAYPKPDAPGVYVDEKKVCSLGLRIRNGCSFHGLALNVNMDLSPFQRINPCGYAGMEMIDTARLNGPTTLETAGNELTHLLLEALSIAQPTYKEGFDE
ncbi:lipoyl(octanoyl) transferase LipB [Alteromonadaceae bacterium A_SAG4]|uniref:lipoyl(octanoyl) transferase LipB n=1 Tax=Alteromonas abrolhosensis TaxID=1892904 RepID=UPI00096B95FD|nr:lipoyl(octanoyl) transferase LipB [Alteromonas abrolhosensis]NKW89758.1 lipoyl(octanoyl) transferase LipB [Alteromonadaceae bacterium A_SAG4]NKX03414.1 lipoyl(octanoyl) transferase LipB [Alteromonadaceae bacterium A_SAG6]NKX18813.1 lipoyl(octanoyl) transferase LipB [Alteromonadaceae bacterium A_SAG5]NKX34927.1 lipoyl(octanoyl) transferase LipB [Alteromonadaceae bacterium A_SAG3]NKX69730.1 lipoyl(octanoyl) transferase LipB [Alteromonadaceae bacterium A_SAG7]